MPGVEMESEKEWRARMDAETLVQSEVIKQDPARHQAAKDKAAQMAQEKEQEKKAMDKVAKAKKGREAATSTRSAEKSPKSPRGKASVGGFNVFKRLS